MKMNDCMSNTKMPFRAAYEQSGGGKWQRADAEK